MCRALRNSRSASDRHLDTRLWLNYRRFSTSLGDKICCGAIATRNVLGKHMTQFSIRVRASELKAETVWAIKLSFKPARMRTGIPSWTDNTNVRVSHHCAISSRDFYEKFVCVSIGGHARGLRCLDSYFKTIPAPNGLARNLTTEHCCPVYGHAGSMSMGFFLPTRRGAPLLAWVADGLQRQALCGLPACLMGDQGGARVSGRHVWRAWRRRPCARRCSATRAAGRRRP